VRKESGDGRGTDTIRNVAPIFCLNIAEIHAMLGFVQLYDSESSSARRLDGRCIEQP